MSEKMQQNKGGNKGNFKLTVPISASQVEGIKEGGKVKVLVVRGEDDEALKDGQSEIIQLDAKRNGTATFTFEKNPGDLRVVLGPPDASDEELLGLQTVTQTVPAHQWENRRDLEIKSILIPPFYWDWWFRWCRNFTIRGRVICANGSPVPGAQVCAYDVDWWWWWSSFQQVGCATTDVNGAFTINFRWCCGFWPWWWWRQRVWQLEPLLAERILPILHRDKTIRKIPFPDPKPDITIFKELVREEDVWSLQRFESIESLVSSDTTESTDKDTMTLQRQQPAFDPTVLTGIREQLLNRLPASAELERLHIWPWWPWQPWYDCSPDINFRVTQICQGQNKIIVNENVFQTRWDIPTNLNVTLIANDQACCLQRQTPDPPNPCVDIQNVCNDPINLIGGNPGAAPTPAGFLRPGLPTIHGDRPYGGEVVVQGLVGNGVDYYEFEWSNNNGATWNDMPSSAVGDIVRQYHEPIFTWQNVPFLRTIDGRLVYESRQHYEATHNPGTWNISRFWTVQDYFSLLRWETSLTSFGDGTYKLRMKGWTLSGSQLINPTYLPICNTQVQNGVVITLDNRLTGPASGHPPSVINHPCDGGTVHTCTMEPDTDVIAVSIIHANSTQTSLGACGQAKITNTDVLRVDFLAYDLSGHLADYDLIVDYSENQQRNLLALAGATLTPLGGAAAVPAAVQVGPSYAQARVGPLPHNGTAVPPIWYGGAIRLEVPAHLAFPETCCYLLSLVARKRTVVSCDHGFWAHSNRSHYSFTVEV